MKNEEIQKLKDMTMKPPLFAEIMLSNIVADLMFGEPKGFEKEYLLRKKESLEREIMVDLLPFSPLLSNN